jgi:hypothetical protein
MIRIAIIVVVVLFFIGWVSSVGQHVAIADAEHFVLAGWKDLAAFLHRH